MFSVEYCNTVYSFSPFLIKITQHWSGLYSSREPVETARQFILGPGPFPLSVQAWVTKESVSLTAGSAGLHLSKLGKQKNKKTHYIIHCPTQSHRLELFTVGWLQNKSVKWVRAFKSVSSEFYLPWPKIAHLSGVEPCDLHHMKGGKNNKQT